MIPLDDEYARLVVLENWLKLNGCSFPLLRLSKYSHEARGVHAAEDIPPDQRVLHVPLKLLITSETASLSPLARKIARLGVSFSSRHSTLALYLLEEREKGVESFWHPYLTSLPQEYDFMPAFYTEEELGWLQGSLALKKIAEQLKGFIEEYTLATRTAPELSRFSLQDFMWGRFGESFSAFVHLSLPIDLHDCNVLACGSVCDVSPIEAVITRIFGMTIQGRDTQGLVPYADMLNHKVMIHSHQRLSDARCRSLPPIRILMSSSPAPSG